MIKPKIKQFVTEYKKKTCNEHQWQLLTSN